MNYELALELKGVFCPTCGDVTHGHPSLDKQLAEQLENGFTTNFSPSPSPISKVE